GLTVLFDMVIAVSFGVVLAALLFMRRMAEITDTRLEEPASLRGLDLPPGIRVYEIAGPLFFGAAQKAVGVVERVDGQSGTVILDMAKVPAMDATGLVALETMMARLRRARHKVVLAGVNPQPAEVLARAGIRREPGTLAFAPDVDTA